MKKEEIAELVSGGIADLNDALKSGRSDHLKNLLDVMSQFSHYSFNNCLLIAQQCPTATYVQGFHGWRKLGRTVRKGEKGIGIAAPMTYRKKEEAGEEISVRGFRVVHVFDISQTDGDELPKFAEPQGDCDEWIKRAEQLIRDKSIDLQYKTLRSGLDGFSTMGKIVIDAGLEAPKRLATLVHELAHELLHPDIESRKENSQVVKETEAEGVAYIVCQSLGLEMLSSATDYIHLHDGDCDVFARSMRRIQGCASAILSDLVDSNSGDLVKNRRKMEPTETPV